MCAIQWQTTKFLWMKYVVVALIMALIGAEIGVRQIHAETKTVNVVGAGNVGTAKTVGIASAGSVGTSSSTVSLFFLRAHIKIWHTGPLLQAQYNKTWSNSKGGNTTSISSSGFGDYSVTYHEFRYLSPNSPTITYTSGDSHYLIFLGSPMITLILAGSLVSYVYWFKAGSFASVINRVEHLGHINGTKFLIACGLTLVSIAIYQSANYITHLGFPLSFITYYNYPITDEVNAFWSRLASKLAIDLLPFNINAVLYYMLLSAFQSLYQKGALWLGGRVHSSH